MSMNVSGYDFDGSYSIDTTVIPANRAAVYVIICRAPDNGYYVKDVGESGEVGIRIANHNRRSCWERNCNGSLSVYLRYMPSSEGYTAADRRKIETIIRNQYQKGGIRCLMKL